MVCLCRKADWCKVGGASGKSLLIEAEAAVHRTMHLT